jgi:prepilin-type N-terminal cleavage/methylation domain-containing protein
MPHFLQRSKGFTLIELLVVIAIIAVLAAILFPVFNAARAKGQEASCSSNMQQIGKAMMLYMQDAESKFPDPRSIGLTPQDAQRVAPMATWCLQYQGVASRLAKYMSAGKNSSKAFLCPAAPNGKAFSPFTNSTGLIGGTPARPMVSYCYRLCLAYYTLYNKGFRDSDCSRPSRQVMFNELAAWHHGNHSAWQVSSPTSGPSPFTGQPLVNVVYIDGHAKLWKQPYITKNSDPKSGPDDWPYDATWFTMGPGGPLNGEAHIASDPNIWDPTKGWDR